MSYELISRTTPLARKDHRCIWCGESIPAGTRYINEFSKYEGETQKHKWHPECEGAAHQYFVENGDGAFDAYSNERPDNQLPQLAAG